MTLEAFLRVWIARGSQGLQADWLRPSERPTQAAPAMSFTERADAAARADFERLTGRAPQRREVIDITPASQLELPNA